MKKKAYLFLFDGFSDWEVAYLTPEINQSEKCELVYFSVDGTPLRSAGGLSIQPATSLAELQADDIDLLILPGGTAWESGGRIDLQGLVETVFERKKTIAAICAATTYFGRMGLLEAVGHTSNSMDYLKEMAPAYRGTDNYREMLAVSDRNIITANGVAPIEFAREIFKALALYSDEEIEEWFQLFKNGIWTS